MPLTLRELARRLGAVLSGNPDATVDACAPIDKAGPRDITFLANPKYARFLESTRAAAVIIDPQTPCPEHVTRLVCDDPYFAFRNALIELYGFRTHPEPIGCENDPDPHGRFISPLAAIHPSASIAPGCRIHPFVSIQAHAAVGRNCNLYPGVYIGPQTSLGDDCTLFPNVTVYDRCTIGDRVTIHSASVIGHDGFGYATHHGQHHKIPQTGVVIIEDDVELGAACAVERAAMGETRIARGTKFADLISIGHGTTVGQHCLFVSLVGVSGSVEVGNYVALGGQVGVSGHLKIGDGAQAAGKTAIVQDVPPGKEIGGIPAIDLDQAKRNALAAQDLYGLAKRVRQLERQLAALRDRLPSDS